MIDVILETPSFLIEIEVAAKVCNLGEGYDENVLAVTPYLALV
jgi:homoserine kinase